MVREAKEMFEEILRILRKRRVEDELKVMNSRIECVESGAEMGVKLEEDPARKDAELNSILLQSFQEGRAKEQMVNPV